MRFMSSACDGPVKDRGVEPWSVVGDHEPGGVAIELYLHADSPRAIGFLPQPLRGQGVEQALVFLPEVGADFEITMEKRIAERFLERDPDLHLAALDRRSTGPRFPRG